MYSSFLLRVPLAAFLLSCSFAYADSPKPVVEGDRIVQYGDHKKVIWSFVQGPELGNPYIAAFVNGITTTNLGYELDAHGRILGLNAGGTSGATPAGANPAAAASWSSPSVLASGFPVFVGPQMDPNGNAVELIEENATGVSIIRSVGGTGSWGTPELVIPPAGSDTPIPAFTIDPMGNITLVYRRMDVAPGQYQLYALRYTPSAGWGEPVLIYGSSVFFQTFDVTSDSHGNVVVLFDLSVTDGTPGVSGAWSAVYSRATDTWSAPLQLSAGTDWANDHSLFSSLGGQHIAAAWLQPNSRGDKVFVDWFDTATLQWQKAAALNGSSHAYFVGGNSAFPGALDSNGNLYIFAMVASGLRESSVIALQSTATTAQRPVTLLRPSNYFFDIYEFNHATVDAQDTVWGEITYVEPNNIQTLESFRHTPGSGWTSATLDTYSYNAITGTSITVYQGSGAALIYNGTVNGSSPYLRSQIFNGTSWSQGPDVPGAPFSSAPSTTMAPSGNAVLSFVDDNQGILYATWLQP